MMSGEASAPPLPADTDSTSGCSADGSNTDSGRGGSEEGEIQLGGVNIPIPAHYGIIHIPVEIIQFIIIAILQVLLIKIYYHLPHSIHYRS